MSRFHNKKANRSSSINNKGRDYNNAMILEDDYPIHNNEKQLKAVKVSNLKGRKNNKKEVKGFLKGFSNQEVEE